MTRLKRKWINLMENKEKGNRVEWPNTTQSPCQRFDVLNIFQKRRRAEVKKINVQLVWIKCSDVTYFNFILDQHLRQNTEYLMRSDEWWPCEQTRKAYRAWVDKKKASWCSDNQKHCDIITQILHNIFFKYLSS